MVKNKYNLKKKKLYLFTDVVSNVSRMSKQCIVRLTTESLCLNVADDSMPMVWCKLAQNHFFVDYLVAGKSEEYNEIYMELATSMLVKSITSLKTAAKCVKIKLTNKQQPCLTFEIELSSVNESRFCVHDVPVTIIPQKKWKEYHEPNILQYDVRIFLNSCMKFVKYNLSLIFILITFLFRFHLRCLYSNIYEVSLIE